MPRAVWRGAGGNGAHGEHDDGQDDDGGRACRGSRPPGLHLGTGLAHVRVGGVRDNAWAVGVDAVKGGLIFHWNGKRWSYLNLAGYFNGVAARSATDVWAVGATSQFADSQPLAVHWNGRSWTRVPTPALKIGGYFNAVAGSSAGSVWAVGLAGPGRGVMRPRS